jgi:aminopeptidase N
MGKSVTRLYSQFQPQTYEIALNPDRDKLIFSGKVVIKGKKTGRPSKRITFHQKGLKIIQATLIKLDHKGQVHVPITRINNQNSYDEVRLHTNDLMYPGEYCVSIEFSGEITRQMNGIYPCYYKDDGVEKMLIATQFESHHAREAFPCIDEPEAKATFQLTLTTPINESVLANTQILMQTEHGDTQKTEFQTTPKMSTYLLAFIYGNLKHTEAKTKDGTIVRVHATPQNIAYTRFALDCAVKTLEFYNEYFDIPYPLEKCDFIALPDFASGAMENWGCITFREQALLVDEKNTSLHLKQYVANVIAHELTHQWFGNLVTMRWWTDLWLNESFASWMSYLAVDELFPEWQVWVQFIVEEQGYALKQDALQNTHPIEVEVRHPDEIRTIFDAISYEKGASVLLMLHKYLGDTTFRDGLRLYLKTHAYGSTDTVDLWDALEKVSERPIKKFMSEWTSLSGYPIIKATIDQMNVSLQQERFYLNTSAQKENALWPIPLLGTQDLSEDTLNNKSQKLVADKEIEDSFTLNHNRSGFFRTVYDTKHLHNLARAIQSKQLNDLDRLGVLSDSFESAKAGYSKTIDSLQLLEAFDGEDSAVVWDVIASGLSSIRSVMDSDALRNNIKPLARRLTAIQLERLGWAEKQSDSHFDRLLRPTILGLASFGEEPSVTSEARKLFDTMTKPEDIHPDIRGIVYGTVSRDGTVDDFEKMLKMHNACTNSEERVTLSSSLTNFPQPELIKRSLKLITSDAVRLQDVAYWIAGSFMNRHAKHTTWKWLTDHWQWLNDNLGTDLSFFRMPIYSARAFSDVGFIPEFEEFFSSHMSPSFERPVKQGIETIQWQSNWKTRDMETVIKYLKTLKND